MVKSPSQAWFNNAMSTVSEHHRVYAVGDVHGRIDLLRSMIDRIDHDNQSFDDDREVKLVFLGDYIDRGDNSREVLDFLMEIECMRPGSCKFLQGNHEAALLDFVANPISGRAWLEWGGMQTIASFGIAPPMGAPNETELLELHEAFLPKIGRYLPFLKLLEPYWVSGQIIFAHASLDPTAPLDMQPKEALLWGKTAPGASRTLPGYKLVHGHFASSDPVSCDEFICVDTGAYYSGKLTAVRLDDFEQFLVSGKGG